MASLFPLVDVPVTAKTETGTDKLYREVLWDYINNCPVWRGGSPVIVTGLEAVKSWAMMALQTLRHSKDIFSPHYGCDLDTLAGQPFSDAVQQSEASRLIRECLMINPYITDVQQISVEFSGATVSMSCSINTVYGEVTIRGN